ncbi:MAG: hypothetical protein AABZ63_04005, partial [Actinomycetota bacterium]
MKQAYRTAPAGPRQKIPDGSVFSLGDDRAYRRWRDAKLARFPRSADELRVEVATLATPSVAETQAMLEMCGRANMCLYRSRQLPGDA